MVSHLFTMRPRGVVSKNAMGHRNMLSSSLLCKCLDADMAPRQIVRARPKTPRARDNTEKLGFMQKNLEFIKIDVYRYKICLIWLYFMHLFTYMLVHFHEASFY